MKLQYFFLVGILGLLILPSCMSTYGFHTAKALEQGQVEVSWDASASFVLQNSGSSDVEAISAHATPGIDLTMRFGTSIEHLDWGFQLHPQAPLGGDVKYQFYGDRESVIALATGLGIGYIPRLAALRYDVLNAEISFPNLWALTVPFYATADWDDRLTFTLAPNYRLYYGSGITGQVVVLHSNIRFRLRKGEWDTSYFVLEGHAGKSIGGSVELDQLRLFGAALGYQVVFEGSGKKKKRKKRSSL